MAAEPKETTTPTPAAAVVEIPLDRIDRHPANQRRFVDPDAGDVGLRELAASIRAVGLLEPVIVRPLPDAEDGWYQLLAGERRWRAMRLVPGATTISAIVRNVGDREALEILVTENLQRKDLSPLEEAAGVKALVDQVGWTIQDVADRLGRSLHWVALRARLANLSPKWQAEAANPKSSISEWSAGHLELVACLEPDCQDGLLTPAGGYQNDREIPRRGDLEREIASLMRELRKAPWKLADEALYPEAGACTACPKRSSCHPGLFDDQDLEKPEKHDHCLDPVCWTEKADRQVAVKEADLRTEHGKVVLLHGEWDPNEHKDHTRKDVTEAWEVDRAKKGENGALPALVVDGRGKGSVRWVKPRERSSGGSSARPRGEDGKPKPSTLKQRRESLGRRRKAAAAELIAEQLKSVGAPEVPFLVRLAAAFGTDENHDSSQHDWHGNGANPQAAWNLFGRMTPEAAASLLWDQVREVLLARLRYIGSQTDMKRLWADAEHCCEALGLDATAALEEAIAALPEPKSWAHLNADGTPKGTKRAKPPKTGKGEAKQKAAKKRKAKPVAGVCRVCGCTENEACETEAGEPCHWVEPDLCSACAPEVDEQLAEEDDEAADEEAAE